MGGWLTKRSISLTMPPRAQFTMCTPFFICAKDSVLMRFLVSGVRGVWRVMKSAWGQILSWVGGWVGWVEEEQAVRMRYCMLWVGGWVGGWEGRRTRSHFLIPSSLKEAAGRTGSKPITFMSKAWPLCWEREVGGWVEEGEKGGWNEVL